MKNEKQIKKLIIFPAPFVAHWATGPVECCDRHAKHLVGLGSFMGTHVVVTHNENINGECSNCINESKDK